MNRQHETEIKRYAIEIARALETAAALPKNTLFLVSESILEPLAAVYALGAESVRAEADLCECGDTRAHHVDRTQGGGCMCDGCGCKLFRPVADRLPVAPVVEAAARVA